MALFKSILSVLIAMAFLVTPVFAAQAAETAKATPAEKPAYDVDSIMNKVDDLLRGKSSESLVEMNVKTQHWQRSMTMKMWSLGEEKSLVKVLKPIKERDTATLKVDKDIWNYLPKTDRTIKLTAAMMMGSWMGSHFTNDDLVRESRWSDDYSSKLGFVGERNGQKLIEIIAKPKPDAPVVWGKVVVMVREKDFMPLTMVYYDEDEEIARTMTFSDFRTDSGRLVPHYMKMTPQDKPEEYTELIYKEITFDIKINASFFSLNQLRRK